MIDEAAARNSGVGTLNMIATDWSRDGRFLATAAGAPIDLWLFDVTGTKPPERIVSSPGDQLHGNFSPDGKFIADTSNEARQHFEVYVETLPPSDRKWPISTNGGYEPRWRADGREIYYLARDGTLMAVPVTAGASPFGVPQPLFQTRVHSGVTMTRTHYVPNRDGSRFLVGVRTRDPVPVAITVMLNWTAGPKQ